MNSYTYKSNFTTIVDSHKIISSKPSIVYIHGLYSDPFGRKPEEVKKFCEENNIGFIRFELIGHGSDKDNYENADINIWKAQVLEVIDNLVTGDLVLVGSSLGGWLSILATLERPDRVKGILGLATASDFTQDLYQIFNETQKKELEVSGKTVLSNNDFTYVFTKQLIDSGRENCLLESKIKINCPVHLLQGMKDASLDWRKALKIADCLESENVTIKLLKNSTHRLNSDSDIKEIKKSLEILIGQ